MNAGMRPVIGYCSSSHFLRVDVRVWLSVNGGRAVEVARNCVIAHLESVAVLSGVSSLIAHRSSFRLSFIVHHSSLQNYAAAPTTFVRHSGSACLVACALLGGVSAAGWAAASSFAPASSPAGQTGAVRKVAAADKQRCVTNARADGANGTADQYRAALFRGERAAERDSYAGSDINAERDSSVDGDICAERDSAAESNGRSIGRSGGYIAAGCSAAVGPTSVRPGVNGHAGSLRCRRAARRPAVPSAATATAALSGRDHCAWARRLAPTLQPTSIPTAIPTAAGPTPLPARPEPTAEPRRERLPRPTETSPLETEPQPEPTATSTPEGEPEPTIPEPEPTFAGANAGSARSPPRNVPSAPTAESTSEPAPKPTVEPTPEPQPSAVPTSPSEEAYGHAWPAGAGTDEPCTACYAFGAGARADRAAIRKMSSRCIESQF